VKFLSGTAARLKSGHDFFPHCAVCVITGGKPREFRFAVLSMMNESSS